MKEFVMIFRSEPAMESQLSPAEMQQQTEGWKNWLGSLAAQNKLGSTCTRLGFEGKAVKPQNLVINGPYVEIKEMVGGFITVLAESIDEAAAIAKGCPMVIGGVGMVEVRDIMPMNN